MAPQPSKLIQDKMQELIDLCDKDDIPNLLVVGPYCSVAGKSKGIYGCLGVLFLRLHEAISINEIHHVVDRLLNKLSEFLKMKDSINDMDKEKIHEALKKEQSK